jgi:5-methylcytosine-specific restriction endonuclease McrA
MENKIYKLTDQEFSDLVKSSLNISEVLFKLGYSTKGNSWGYSQVKQRMKDLNLSGKDFRGKSPMLLTIEQKKISREDLLCVNSKHSRNVLRRYIINNKLIPYRCNICGINEWQNKKLSLELDHINGINNDNRIENLRFLCPNCHSQTVTYGSKNNKKVSPEYEVSEDLQNKIINTYLELRNQKKVSETLRISPIVVKQILLKVGLGKQNQKYIIQYDSNHNELRRFGSISECCQWIMNNNLVTTKLLKTCRATLNRNIGTLWKNYYFEII